MGSFSGVFLWWRVITLVLSKGFAKLVVVMEQPNLLVPGRGESGALLTKAAQVVG